MIRAIVRSAAVALALAGGQSDAAAQAALDALTPEDRVRVFSTAQGDADSAEGSFVRVVGPSITVRADDGVERTIALDGRSTVSVFKPGRRLTGAALGAGAGAAGGGLFVALINSGCQDPQTCPGKPSMSAAGVAGVFLIGTIGAVLGTSAFGPRWRTLDVSRFPVVGVAPTAGSGAPVALQVRVSLR